MDQAVSRQPLITDAGFHSVQDLRRTKVNWERFLSRYFSFAYQRHSSIWYHDTIKSHKLRQSPSENFGWRIIFSEDTSVRNTYKIVIMHSTSIDF